LLAAFFCASVFGAGPDENREFFSKNKAYVLKVTKSGSRGSLKYFFELKNSEGKKNFLVCKRIFPHRRFNFK